MKLHLSPQERERTLANIVTCFAAACFLAAVLYLGQINEFIARAIGAVGPFFVGALFAFVMLPISAALERFMTRYILKKTSPKVVHGLAITFSMIILIAFLVGFFLILLPQLISSVRSLVDVLTNFVNNNEARINEFLIKNGLITVESSELNTIWDNLLSTSTQYITVVLPNLLSLSNTVYRFVFHLFVGLIIACHLLIDRNRMSRRWKRAYYAIFSEPTADAIIHWSHKAYELFANFISGKIVDSVIIGLICYAFMLITGLRYSLLISVIIGVTNILPFFGPFIGAIPSIFILLMIDPTSALIFGIFIIILQQVDGNLIGPKILGDHVGISSLWTMFAIILGSGLFGFVGILLGVPVFALFYAFINAILEVRLKKKGLPLDVEAYDKSPLEKK